jgi:hypothetical protein
MTDKDQVANAAAQIKELLDNSLAPGPRSVEDCHERLLHLRAGLAKCYARLLDSSSVFYGLCQAMDGGPCPPVGLVVGLKQPHVNDPAECRISLDITPGSPLMQTALAHAGAAYAADWRAVHALAKEADYLCSELIPKLLADAAPGPSEE